MCDIEETLTKSQANNDVLNDEVNALSKHDVVLNFISANSKNNVRRQQKQQVTNEPIMVDDIKEITYQQSRKIDEQHPEQQLHQTTQSFHMASTMFTNAGGCFANMLSVSEQPNITPVLTTPTTTSTSGSMLMLNSSTHLNVLNFPTKFSMQRIEQQSTILQQVPNIKLNIEELLHENNLLREKLKEVTGERDRLLCQVSNLRLELDMSELKRLPLER